jgi:hypothetical protein
VLEVKIRGMGKGGRLNPKEEGLETGVESGETGVWLRHVAIYSFFCVFYLDFNSFD